MSKAKRHLDERVSRTDLTSRECAKLLGGMIGGLVQLADVDDVRTAVRFWAESDDGWKAMRGTKLAMSVDPQ